jgi:hypothetical protein
MAGSPEKPPSGWKVAVWGLAVFAGTRIAAILLAEAAMASTVAQAVIAEWGVGRLGVAWSDPQLDPPPTATQMAKRAGIGAGVGAVVAIVVVGALLVMRAIVLTPTSPATSIIAVSIISAGLLAMRDELILHGLTLRAVGDETPAFLRVLACAITSAAAAFGTGESLRGAIASGLLGAVFGALWLRDRGAWLPWGAHTAWIVTTDLALRGGLFTLTWNGAEAGPLASSAGVLSLLPFGAAAIVWAARR